MKWLFILVFFTLISPAFAIPNPASVYCIRHGGQLIMEKGKQGWIAYCLFPDRSYCEEWRYLRGNCKPGERFLPKKTKKCHQIETE